MHKSAQRLPEASGQSTTGAFVIAPSMLPEIKLASSLIKSGERGAFGFVAVRNCHRGFVGNCDWTNKNANVIASKTRISAREKVSDACSL